MKRSREPDEEPSSPSTGSDDTGPAEPRSKIVGIDAADETTSMTCLLHKQRLRFGSYEEYESHYSKEHLNRCLECKKNFPSSHLLGVHIEDRHDPLVLVRREKGEHTVGPRPKLLLPRPSSELVLTKLSRQYSCFVEDCERKCGSPDKRRRHLIDKHMYPRNFFFAVTRDGIDGRRSLLEDGSHRHRRRSSAYKTEMRGRPGAAEAGPSKEAAGPAAAGRRRPGGPVQGGARRGRRGGWRQRTPRCSDGRPGWRNVGTEVRAV